MFKKLKVKLSDKKVKLVSYMHRETEYVKMFWVGLIFFLIGGLSLGIIGQWFSNGISNFFGAISSFPAMYANCGSAMIIFYIVDRYVLKNIDTYKRLKEKNHNYIIFMCIFGGIIIASILKS